MYLAAASDPSPVNQKREPALRRSPRSPSARALLRPAGGAAASKPPAARGLPSRGPVPIHARGKLAVGLPAVKSERVQGEGHGEGRGEVVRERDPGVCRGLDGSGGAPRALGHRQLPPSLLGSSQDPLAFPNVGKEKEPRERRPEALQRPGGWTKDTHDAEPREARAEQLAGRVWPCPGGGRGQRLGYLGRGGRTRVFPQIPRASAGTGGGWTVPTASDA